MNIVRIVSFTGFFLTNIFFTIFANVFFEINRIKKIKIIEELEKKEILNRSFLNEKEKLFTTCIKRWKEKALQSEQRRRRPI